MRLARAAARAGRETGDERFPAPRLREEWECFVPGAGVVREFGARGFAFAIMGLPGAWEFREEKSGLRTCARVVRDEGERAEKTLLRVGRKKGP